MSDTPEAPRHEHPGFSTPAVAPGIFCAAMALSSACWSRAKRRRGARARSCDRKSGYRRLTAIGRHDGAAGKWRFGECAASPGSAGRWIRHRSLAWRRRSRGVIVACLDRGNAGRMIERGHDHDGRPCWRDVGPENRAERDSYLESRRRYDRDLWLIELDSPDAARFAAETIAVD